VTVLSSYDRWPRRYLHVRAVWLFERLEGYPPISFIGPGSNPATKLDQPASKPDHVLTYETDRKRLAAKAKGRDGYVVATGLDLIMAGVSVSKVPTSSPSINTRHRPCVRRPISSRLFR
jgi:hypothetical protein